MAQEEKKSKRKKKETVKKGTAKFVGYGVAVTFLMVWVFILGLLTGRGDVNYLLQRLGLYKTNLAARLGLAPSNQLTAALPLPQPTEDQKPSPDSGKKPAQEAEVAEITPAAAPATAKASEPVAPKAPAETAKKPGAGNLEAKKPKGSTQPKNDQPNSIASKLSFQNSLDTPTKKPAKTPAKKEGAVHTASLAPHSSSNASEPTAGDEKKKTACAYQVRVASYRTTEEAEKMLADLKKKGFNVNLQKGKDKTGPIYVIKTGRYTNKAEAEKVTKKLKEANLSGKIQELNQ